MNNEENKIIKKGMSPLTAAILGVCGIIIAAILAGGYIASEGIDKIKDPEGFVESISDRPGIEDARVFVEQNWPDLRNDMPECQDGAEVCPSLIVGVSKKFNDRTNKVTHYISAEIVGFADDSYSGYGREAMVKYDNGAWQYFYGTAENNPYAYTDFTLCRNMQRYPKDAVCP